MFRANTLYEGQYLLGTAIARPLIAKRQIEIAKLTGADAVCHGATGKGNDQVRFELGYYALNPEITVISPWREWDLSSRSKLIEFAEQNQIPIPKDKLGEAPFSVDANILHTSTEGKLIEDPINECPEYLFQRTLSIDEANDTPTDIIIGFQNGDPISINGTNLSPANLLDQLNQYGKENGVGRLDIIENRYVGMKSRGIYETPGGTILLKARRAMEELTLDSGSMHLKEELMPKYAKLIYNGLWFSPEREMLQRAIDYSQEYVSGEIKIRLHKGNIIILNRKSKTSLYDTDLVSFEDSDTEYEQSDANGFIKINALRLRMLARRNK